MFPNAAVLHEMEESDNHPSLSLTDNDILTLGLNVDKLNEVPTTVKEDDPVTAILKGVEDVIRGESTENACETFEDWKNIETADDIILEMLIADLAKTAESADQHEETDCDKPSFDLGDPL